MKKVLLVTALVLSATTASAMTVDIAGNVNEGGGIPASFYPSSPDQTIGDLPNNNNGTIYRWSETTTLFGGVVNVGDVYQDVATFDFAGTFDVVLSWFEVPDGNAFDARLTFGTFDQMVYGNGSVILSGVSGMINFAADPTQGHINHDRFGYTISATPVPLPAGVLLMGTALAGFGVMRRQQKKT